VADLIVRRANAGDLAAINALGEVLMGPHADRLPEIFLRDGMEPYWRKCLDAEDHAVFVAGRGSAVIGMAVAQLMDETSPVCHAMKLCRLNTIVVDETARGAGAGRALIEAVEAFARASGAADIRLSVADFNEEAIALYRRMGYTIRAHVMGKLIRETD
jgi:ribosomal protein S18 acetylase RimI-like enzyme